MTVDIIFELSDSTDQCWEVAVGQSGSDVSQGIVHNITFTQPDDNQSHVSTVYSICCAVLLKNKQSHVYTAILQSIAGMVLLMNKQSHAESAVPFSEIHYWCTVQVLQVTLFLSIDVVCQSTEISQILLIQLDYRNNNEETLMAVQTIKVVKVLAGYIIPALSNQ